ncbi:hypothetical protein WOC76_04050 [Methylocystis sp. IM3]|uniref:hypothetical protein n=1 Tax=unclassified Methylocystis TaxID=2625913 RepID=UPI0030F4F7FD
MQTQTSEQIQAQAKRSTRELLASSIANIGWVLVMDTNAKGVLEEMSHDSARLERITVVDSSPKRNSTRRSPP